MPLKKYASTVRLEAVFRIWVCRLWEGPIIDIWARNSSLFSLSRSIWWSRVCIYRSFSRWRLSIISCRQNSLRHPWLMIGFWRVLTSLVPSHRWHQCWCCANWIQVRLVSLESNELLPCTKGCPNKWSGHAPPKLKLESSKSEPNCFKWLYACVYLFQVSRWVLIEHMTLSSQRWLCIHAFLALIIVVMANTKP